MFSAIRVASRVKSFVLVLFLVAAAGALPAYAATQSGTLTSGSYAYHDITLPTPQSGLRVVVSTSASSTVSLYTGSVHSAGSYITSSGSNTLHTLLVAPGSLTDGASYHVRIYANTALTYTSTDDPKYISKTLDWDDGLTLDGKVITITTQPDTAGGDYLFKIVGQLPVHPAWRTVLTSINGLESDLYLQQGSPPVTGGTYSSNNAVPVPDAIYLAANESLVNQEWYIRVHAVPGATWKLVSGDLHAPELLWDNGDFSDHGAALVTQQSTSAGDYFFYITSKTSYYGAWRTVLNVTGGEADLYLQQTAVPVGDTTYKSTKTGDDGFVLSPGQFANNQTWYIRVHATGASSTWNIFSGDIYVRNLNTLDVNGIPNDYAVNPNPVDNISTALNVTIGPEGLAYFKTTVDANSQAWKLWLNGSSNQIYVSNGKAPVKNIWAESAEQSETGQALLVPPYLTSALYLVGIKGIPGTVFTIDSQLQPTPVLAFGASTGSTPVSGYGFKTYKVEVPSNQIGWQVNLAPNAGQNPELYIRKGYVPNRWMNDAYSEAPAGVTDSITQVPPTLTDGTWYITVYGSGGYTFNLENKIPVVTGKPFINTSDPNPVPSGYSYPYNTSPITNDDTNRSGWRYYQVSDINSQLGFLGWQLDLDPAHQPGYEIALRRNAVPARWNFRSGGSSYSTYSQQSSHVDQSSTIGMLQQPGHQADIWYIGVYTPNQALGAFQLTTREIPAPLKSFSQSSVYVGTSSLTPDYPPQDPSTWKWFKYTVPSDSTLKGWDLRLKVTGGSPQMVVRRDQLPADFNASYCQNSNVPQSHCNTWGSGLQWAATPGQDWTGRNVTSTGPDKNGYLIMGLGSPLEVGTYYVGITVSPSNVNDTNPMSYSLESTGIGTAVSSYPFKIQDLAYSATQATGAETQNIKSGSLANPRDVAWYHVTVPAGGSSWSLNLVPTAGEAMLAVRHGVLPNIVVQSSTTDTTNVYSGGFSGVKRQKFGTEYFYKYAPYDQTTITSGDYYVAVISEGLAPPADGVVGSGGISYTLTSDGAMPIESTGVVGNGVFSWPGQSVPCGAQKVYRFSLPANKTSVEVRFKNRKDGLPTMGIRQDAGSAGRIPSPLLWQNIYQAHEDGNYAAWQSRNANYSNTVDIVTIASPAAGDYTVTVAANPLPVRDVNGNIIAWSYPDAKYDLEVEVMGTIDLAFANGTAPISDQDPQSWRYFKVTVPVDSTLKGWDLRLKTTSGTPQMVVRRSSDQLPLLPGDFNTSYCQNSYFPQSYCNSWVIGLQWAATPGQDWTGRQYLTGSPTYTVDKNSYLIMGMGSPLEAGIYYVGVSRRDSSNDPTPLSYTLESRGIGTVASSYPIKIQDLAYAGGTVNATGLAPRDVAWYHVTVPAGGSSWSLNMVPTQGEAMLAVRQGGLPNIAAQAYTSDNTNLYSGGYSGVKRHKSGAEYFYKYSPQDQSTITSGDYYVAVISEGQSPSADTVIGTNTVNYTLTSDGVMPIETTGVVDNGVFSWPGQSVPYGAQKVYRFSLPASKTSVEVRFKKGNKEGNPMIGIRQDAVGTGRIPSPPMWKGGYQAHEDGNSSAWYNLNQNEPTDIVTIASPSAGDYTVTVVANPLPVKDINGNIISWSYQTAKYDLEVEVMGTIDLAFANGTAPINDQDPQSWRYFKVTVPTDATLKGWDLRLKATSGTPQMVVRRSDPQLLQLPGDFNTSYCVNSSASLSYCNTWGIGLQWAATPGYDWTGRNVISTNPYTYDKNSYLIMGMGSPLEAGTYYVGVSRRDSSNDPTPLSYSLESRGIGTAVSSYPIKIQDLAYSATQATGAETQNIKSGSLANPRDVAWYHVTVPAGGSSWSLNLVPTAGEAMLAVRQGVLPNIVVQSSTTDTTNVYSGGYSGVKRHKSGTEYFYKYAPYDQTTITSGDYYVAVISEGLAPPADGVVGSGGVSYTLTSVGAMPIDDKTSSPVAENSIVSWPGQTLSYGAQKVYRFRVTTKLTGVEVRFRNKVGNPMMSVRQDAAGSGRIPYPPLWQNPNQAHEDGNSWTWHSQNSQNDDPVDVVTIASPAVGDYTITVAANPLPVRNIYGSIISWVYPDASFDMEVTVKVPAVMSLTGSHSCLNAQQQAEPCHLIDQQVAYYQVEVPAKSNGYDVVGWKINTAATNGSTALRVAKGEVPGGTTPSLTTSAPVTIVAPPYLSPGTWFIEVKGNGITDYAISSDIISGEPGRNQRSWDMPTKDNKKADKTTPFEYPTGLSAPEIGDSGIKPDGSHVDNPNTHDQGIDLAENDWHFYRIVVPDNNAGHLKTIVEALSGKPELYIRAGAAPSPYHKNHAVDPNDYYTSSMAYDRFQTVSGTMYGNWVPLDRRTELQLKPGDWWLGIKAVNSNIRYRLRVAAGNVRDGNNPVDSSIPQLKLFQDLHLNGGSVTDQSLPAGAMRYYRVTVPPSDTNQANSTPTRWNLTLTQQVGDVAVFIRDTLPPGQGNDGNALNYPYTYSYTNYFQDWYDDNSNVSGNPYVTIDTPGTTPFSIPPLRPGATYYVGVYARTDATFNLLSGIGTDTLKLDGLIPFSNGSISPTLLAGETRIYRIDVPADALVWHHTSTHDGAIRLYLAQGTVPPKDASAHWYTWGNSDSSLNQNLTAYPWQPGYSYYLVVENTSGSPLTFTFTMAGKSALSRLTVNVSGNCTGSSVATSPNVLTCTTGTCTSDIMPYSSIWLYPAPGSGCSYTMSGSCTGACTLDMASAATVNFTFSDTAGPTINTFSIPPTSSVPTVDVTFSATDNVGVTGYCVSESDVPAGCVWKATPPASYTFSGIANNTPTGKWLYAYARDAAGNISSQNAYTTITITEAILTATVAGTGSGAVNSSPSGIACTGGVCSHNYALGTVVSLTATPSSDSQFAGWSGSCSGTGSCSVTMSAAKNVTATFNSLPPARIVTQAGTTYHATLALAYAAAADNDTIQLKEGVLTGNFTADRNINVKLKGGYNASYGAVSSSTRVEGRVNIRNGSVRTEKINIK